jgi:hypothetical protein
LADEDSSSKIEPVKYNNLSSNDFVKNFEVGSKNKFIKSNAITCIHPNCELTFKTQKLKTLHHNNLDVECRDEKYELLKTLSKFIKFFKKQSKNKNLKYDIKNDEEFKNLLKIYSQFHKNYRNKELLLSVLGEYEDLTK